MRSLLRPFLMAFAVIVGVVAGQAGLAWWSASHPVTSLFDEERVTAVYETASPAVVQVVVPSQGFPQLGIEISAGSGFLLDREGFILTNYHVVEGASVVRVHFRDGQQVDGHVVATAETLDVAVVKVASNVVANIAPLTLGDSSKLKAGQLAVVLGYPLDLGQSISVGVVNGLGRTVVPNDGPRLHNMLQTDAHVSPGSSGGPLLDVDGQVIGMVTAARISQDGDVRLGFAIPSTALRDVLPQLVRGESIRRGWMGIRVADITPEVAAGLGLPVDRGAYVLEVTPGSPAARAGLVAAGVDAADDPLAGGDVITAVDGTDTPSADDLIDFMTSKRAGESVTLKVRRREATVEVRVTLAEWPDE